MIYGHLRRLRVIRVAANIEAAVSLCLEVWCWADDEVLIRLIEAHVRLFLHGPPNLQL